MTSRAESPPPENRAGAPGKECAHNPDETSRKVTVQLLEVNSRFCRPVAVGDLARQAFDALRVQFETGREFAARKDAL